MLPDADPCRSAYFDISQADLKISEKKVFGAIGFHEPSNSLAEPSKRYVKTAFRNATCSA